MLPMGLGDVVHQDLTFHNMKLGYILAIYQHFRIVKPYKTSIS